MLSILFIKEILWFIHFILFHKNQIFITRRLTKYKFKVIQRLPFIIVTEDNLIYALFNHIDLLNQNVTVEHGHIR